MKEFKNNNSHKWFLLLAGLAVLAVMVLLYVGPLHDLAVQTTKFLMDKEGAREYFQSHQPYSALYFIGLSILQVVLAPIPGELSSFLGGVVFGWLPGFIYGSVGLTIGSLINVTLGRIFERVFLEKIIPARMLDNFESRVERYGLLTVFILFVFPGAPKDIMCYLFGLSRISILKFIIVSSIARMPGTLVLSLQGAKVFEGDWTYFIILTAGAMVLLIPAIIFRERIFSKLGITDISE